MKDILPCAGLLKDFVIVPLLYEFLECMHLFRSVHGSHHPSCCQLPTKRSLDLLQMVDEFCKSLMHFFLAFSPCANNLSVAEKQECGFSLSKLVHKPWKLLRLVLSVVQLHREIVEVKIHPHSP